MALFVGSRGARRTLRYGRSSLKLPPTRIASRESLRLSALVMHRTFASLARGTQAQAQISPLRGAAAAGLRRLRGVRRRRPLAGAAGCQVMTAEGGSMDNPEAQCVGWRLHRTFFLYPL